MDNPITVSLPQDLPTNWTQGQIIGPNGTDVGLTQQHGYNYLMQQVNAAQQAAEEVGDAFSGAAAQTDLTAHINNKSNPHNVTAEQAGADPAGSAQAVQSNLTVHINDKNNPHGVTAEQVGADPKGSASSAVSTHNQDEGAHPAIQEKLNGVSMAVRATYPVSEGQTINQGDVVDVVDGQIQKTLAPQTNVETVVYSNQCACTASCNLSNGKTVSIFSANSSYYGSIMLFENGSATGSVSLDSIANACDVIALSNSIAIASKYVASAWSSYVCTISGSSITKGGSWYVATSSESPTPYGKTIPLSETTFLAVYGTSIGLRAKIGSVSGTTINFGSYVALPGNTSASYISATRLPDSGTTRRVCVCYADGGDSNKGKAVIVSIDDSNNVTWGTPVVFANSITQWSTGSSISVSSIFDDCVVAYSDQGNSNKLCATSISCSGSTVSVGSTIVVSTSSAADISSCSLSNLFCLICYEGSSSGKAYILSNSKSLSVSGSYKFKSGTSTYNSCADLGSNNILVSYAGNSSYGTATVLTVAGNQIAGSFLDSSKDAIALQSGTEGQSIEVIYSGTVNAEWVTAGQTITSDGVYGVGVLDGVLQVWSKDRPRTTFETGSYIGTGKYGTTLPTYPTSITFSNPVSLVIIVGYEISGQYRPLVQDNSDSGQNCFPIIPCFALGNDYTQSYGPYYNTGLSAPFAKISEDRKTVTWYNTISAEGQLNFDKRKYFYIGFCEKGG